MLVKSIAGAHTLLSVFEVLDCDIVGKVIL